MVGVDRVFLAGDEEEDDMAPRAFELVVCQSRASARRGWEWGGVVWLGVGERVRGSTSIEEWGSSSVLSSARVARVYFRVHDDRPTSELHRCTLHTTPTQKDCERGRWAMTGAHRTVR